MADNRVKTGVPGLDTMLEGGYLEGTANLIEGAPGTGKTTIGMQFIYTGIVTYQQPGLILTFEQFPEQYYQNAAAFGWDFAALEQQGHLKVIMTSPEVTQQEISRVSGLVETAIYEMGVQRVLVDSISHFSRLTNDPVALRELEYRFINAFKRYDVTCIFTHESSTMMGQYASSSDLGYLVDSYTILRYVEIESMIRKAMFILKMRGSHHAKDIRQYKIGQQGVEVRAKFEGQAGILSGSPHRMSDSFVEAFVKR